MIGARHMLAARRTAMILALLVTVLVAVVVWRDEAVVLDYFPPQPKVGLAADELGSFVLGAFLPALTVNMLSVQERLSMPLPRLILATHLTIIALLPALTVPLWVAVRQRAQPLDTFPPIGSRMGSFILIGLIGLLLTLLAGALWGPILSLVTFIGFAIAQNAFGATFGAHVLATGDQWHANWWANALAFSVAGWLAYRWGGVPRLGGLR